MIKKRKLVVIDGAYIYLSIDYVELLSVIFVSVGVGVFYFFTNEIFLPRGDIKSLVSFKMFQYISAHIAYFVILRLLIRMYLVYGYRILFIVFGLVITGGVYYVSTNA